MFLSSAPTPLQGIAKTSVSHQYYATNHDTKPHFIVELPQNRGRSTSIFFDLPQLFYYAVFFPLKSKLKYITICLPSEISNDILWSFQFSRQILPLLPLILSNVHWHYSVLLDLRHSIIEVNESNTQDVIRAFANLIPTETLVFFLYLSKFANSLFRNFCNHKLLRNKLLRNLFLWFWPEIKKNWSSKYSFG